MQPPRLILAAGKKFAGKSNETLLQCLWTLAGNPYKNIRGLPILYFDNNFEYGDYKFHNGVEEKKINIQTIDIKYVPTLCANPRPEIRRIIPIFPNGTIMEHKEDKIKLLSKLLKRAFNCVIVIEDFNTIFGDALPELIVSIICSNRQRGQHIFAHFQGIGRIGHPKLISNSNYMRMHKTDDSVQRHAEKFGEFVPIMSVAEHIINENFYLGQKTGNVAMQKFFLTIDKDHGKIRGFVTKKQAEEAIQFYLATPANSQLSIYKNLSNNKGKKLYTAEEAYSIVEQRMFNTYFDFPKGKSAQK